MEHKQNQPTGWGWRRGAVYAMAGLVWVTCLVGLGFINQIWFMMTAEPPEAQRMAALIWFALGPALPAGMAVAGSLVYGHWQSLTERHTGVAFAAAAGTVMLGIGFVVGTVMLQAGRVSAWVMTATLVAHVATMLGAIWMLVDSDAAAEPPDPEPPQQSSRWLDWAAGGVTVGVVAFFVYEAVQMYLSTAGSWWSGGGAWLGAFALVGPVVFYALFVVRDDALRAVSEAFPVMARVSAFVALVGGIGPVLFSQEPTPWPMLGMVAVFWGYQLACWLAASKGPRHDAPGT